MAFLSVEGSGEVETPQLQLGGEDDRTPQTLPVKCLQQYGWTPMWIVSARGSINNPHSRPSLLDLHFNLILSGAERNETQTLILS